jgi:hypothetical protein
VTQTFVLSVDVGSAYNLVMRRYKKRKKEKKEAMK